MRKPRKVAPDPSHPKSQEKHTLWRSTSTFLINTSRGEPGYKRDVCDAQVTSRQWFIQFFNIENKGKKGIASWRKESWGMYEAMACNGWTLTVTMVWLNGSSYCPRFLKNRGRKPLKLGEQKKGCVPPGGWGHEHWMWPSDVMVETCEGPRFS